MIVKVNGEKKSLLREGENFLDFWKFELSKDMAFSEQSQNENATSKSNDLLGNLALFSPG